MGSSSSTQKRNDRTPLPRLKKSAGSEGGGQNANEEVCPLVFRVQLSASKLLKEGQQLTIAEGKKVQVFGRDVGELSKHQVKMVERCKGQGVTYIGTVIKSKVKGETVYYGEFRQQ